MIVGVSSAQNDLECFFICLIFTDIQSQSQERAAMATSGPNLAFGHMGKGNSQTPMMFTAMLTNLMVRQLQNEALLILRVN